MRTRGLIHCYTGDGKGKTSAAAGLAVRAAGSGMKVLFAQFLKDGSSSELRALERMEEVSCVRMPERFGFFRSLDEEGKGRLGEATQAYFDLVTARASAEAFDLLVLDEFMAAYRLKLFDPEKARRFLREKPEALEVVLTGRDAPGEITELCDYVTELKKIKHPYDRGIAARRGIEY